MTITKEKRREYQARQLLKLKQYILRFSLSKDADVILKLESVPNKTDYVRKLVRNDLQS